jgi:molybdopterin molybdotransferase
MISVAEADRILAQFRGVFPAESVPLEVAAGRILREDICADRAYPAQDRSRMDGIGIAHADWERGHQTFVVAGLARAGDPRTVLSRHARIEALMEPHSPCVEIMTGAPVPEGADTIVPYEDVVIENGVARLRDGVAVRLRQFVHVHGSDCARGEVLVDAGVALNAAHLAVAASVGKATLLVARRPRVAIVSTGDELVSVEATPLDHQLRISNAHGLAAMFAPWAEVSRHHCGDAPAALETLLKSVLAESDMVLVSGGVSAGKFDAVPATLESLGVRKVFHKIAQKPGKPLWFGAMPSPQTPLPLASVAGEGLSAKGSSLLPLREASGVRALVFGLPGNPVSSLVCARRFVLPLLWTKLGWTSPPTDSAPLAAAVDAPSRLTQYLPVRLGKSGEGGKDGARLVAKPHAVNGSGDFATLGGSDGFLELPPEQNHYPAGSILSFFAWSP